MGICGNVLDKQNIMGEPHKKEVLNDECRNGYGGA